MLVRAEALPGPRQIDAWLAVIFPEGNLATVLCRGEWPQPADGVRAGRLQLDAATALQAWTIACSDTALVFPTAGAFGLPGKGERTGAATHITIDARFEATMPPEGRVDRETDVNAEGFVRVVSAGRFEQAGTLRGRLKAGAREMTLEALGVRERTWGPSAAAPGAQISVAFDDGFALGARAVVHDGRTMRGGWVRSDGATRSITALRLETEQDARNVTALRAHIEDGDAAHEVTGDVVATMPGREGGLRSRRCVVRFRCGEREAFGFAELIDA